MVCGHAPLPEGGLVRADTAHHTAELFDACHGERRGHGGELGDHGLDGRVAQVLLETRFPVVEAARRVPRGEQRLDRCVGAWAPPYPPPGCQRRAAAG